MSGNNIYTYTIVLPGGNNSHIHQWRTSEKSKRWYIWLLLHMQHEIVLWKRILLLQSSRSSFVRYLHGPPPVETFTTQEQTRNCIRQGKTYPYDWWPPSQVFSPNSRIWLLHGCFWCCPFRAEVIQFIVHLLYKCGRDKAGTCTTIFPHAH